MADVDVTAINDLVRRENVFINAVMAEVAKVIVGQKYLIERLMIGLLADGHVLVEGVPGLAKTTAVKTLSSVLQTRFQRLQFTPDMLPADLIGTLVYDQRQGTFSVRKGPLFANIILADEINRAPAKVQSALLEAMQERQVTIGDQTHLLEDPFLVLATQNPIEQEGTYPLPEAQVDRFMLKLRVTYPSREEELSILRRMAVENRPVQLDKLMSPQDILRIRGVVAQIYADDRIQNYIVDLVESTRDPLKFGLTAFKGLILYGASPRATINLLLAAKAHAFIQGRGYVIPQDIKALAPDVLRHRVIPTYEAEAESKNSDDLVQGLLSQVPLP